jgi:hypothetical protein
MGFSQIRERPSQKRNFFKRHQKSISRNFGGRRRGHEKENSVANFDRAVPGAETSVACARIKNRMAVDKKFWRIAILCAALGGCFQAAGQEARRFVQDRFAIGYWVGPETKENLRERYREIADANFTLVIGSHGMAIDQQLAYCREFGLKAIVDAKGLGLPANDACWGFSLMDEPGAAQFPELAKRAEEARARQPGKFGYINLFPNYASPAQLGTATYEEHVAKFVREVKPEVLSMDHYPLMRPDADGRDAYLENLAVMRAHSLRAGIPFWNFFYNMPFNDRLDPTEAQIRWQIFASIAHGAKGVLYFCYWTPGKGAAGAGEFPKGGAIITAEGLKTRHYEEARRINAELKNYGPTLMKLTSERVVKIKTDADTRPALAGLPLRNIARVQGDPVGEFEVGIFSNADGGKAVLIVNHNYSFTAWPTLEFAADARDVLEVSKNTGANAPVVDDSPELKGLQISFGAGDARLFLLPAKQ